ncbi:MAG: hypothetical protein SGJ05_07655 [bacterium]|nr:hypothetical protein [bacterium]
MRGLLIILSAITFSCTMSAQWDATGRVPLYANLDPAGGQGYTTPPNRICADGLDRIVATGVEKGAAGSRCTLIVQRFWPDGYPDLTFGESGLVRIETDTSRDARPRGVYVNANNALLAVVSDSTKTAIYKIDASGKLDSSYGEYGRAIISDRNWHLRLDMYASGHDMYLLCQFSRSDSSRSRLLHLSSDGQVQSDSMDVPFDYGQIVVDESGLFVCYERSIKKWTKQGLWDSAFGKAGKVEWQERSGGSNIYSAFNINDSTIACFGLEEYRGPAIQGVESFVVFVDKRDGRIVRHVQMPFYIWSIPRSWMRFADIADDGVVTVGGYRTRDTYNCYVEFFRLSASNAPDQSFFGDGRFLLPPKAPDSSATIEGMAVLSNGDIVFMESTRMLGRIFVKPTTVDDDVEAVRASVTAFPNPTSGHLELSSTIDLSGCTYTIASSTGEIVYSGAIDGTPEIVLPHRISSGTYSLCIASISGATIALNVVLVR